MPRRFSRGLAVSVWTGGNCLGLHHCVRMTETDGVRSHYGEMIFPRATESDSSELYMSGRICLLGECVYVAVNMCPPFIFASENTNFRHFLNKLKF